MCIDGKPHVATEDGVVCYNYEEGKWELGEAKMGSFWFTDSYCEVKNVFVTTRFFILTLTGLVCRIIFIIIIKPKPIFQVVRVCI